MNLIRQKQIHKLEFDISNLYFGSDVFNRVTSFSLGEPEEDEAQFDSDIASEVTTLHIHTNDPITGNRYVTLTEFQQYDHLIVNTKSGQIIKYEIQSISEEVDESNEGYFILTIQHSFGYSNTLTSGSYTYYFRKSASDELIEDTKTLISLEKQRALGAEALLQNSINSLSVATSDLIALTKIENTTDSDVLGYNVHYYANTPSNTFRAIKWNIDGDDVYAKVTFTPPESGNVRIVFNGYLEDAGGTSECWMGLHTSEGDTTQPHYGLFQITKNAEANSWDIEKPEFILTDLPTDEEITVYFHAITTTTLGTSFLVGGQERTAWSNVDMAKPTTICVYKLDVTIQNNPT